METLSEHTENAAQSAPALSPQTTHAHTRRRLGFFLVISLVNVGFLMLLASQLLTPIQTQHQGTVSSPLIGHPAPDFTLPRLDPSHASMLRLAQLKGAPLVIN